jgi:hypothetical protein
VSTGHAERPHATDRNALGVDRLCDHSPATCDRTFDVPDLDGRFRCFEVHAAHQDLGYNASTCRRSGGGDNGSKQGARAGRDMVIPGEDGWQIASHQLRSTRMREPLRRPAECRRQAYRVEPRSLRSWTLFRRSASNGASRCRCIRCHSHLLKSCYPVAKHNGRMFPSSVAVQIHNDPSHHA